MTRRTLVSALFCAYTSVAVWGCLSDTALADDPYNNAEVWRSWSVPTKSAYIWGLRDGLAHAYVDAAFRWLPKGVRDPRIKEAVLLEFDAPTLGPVMTDLYSDPANAFIELREMAEVACDKIKGSDVQDRLLRARRYAVESHKMMERLKTK